MSRGAGRVRLLCGRRLPPPRFRCGCGRDRPTPARHRSTPDGPVRSDGPLRRGAEAAIPQRSVAAWCKLRDGRRMAALPLVLFPSLLYEGEKKRDPTEGEEGVEWRRT